MPLGGPLDGLGGGFVGGGRDGGFGGRLELGAFAHAFAPYSVGRRPACHFAPLVRYLLVGCWVHSAFIPARISYYLKCAPRSMICPRECLCKGRKKYNDARSAAANRHIGAKLIVNLKRLPKKLKRMQLAP